MDTFTILAMLLTVPTALLSLYIIKFNTGRRTWKECVAHLIAVPAVLSLLFFGAETIVRTTSLQDIEIISGQVTNKRRIQDTYQESYDCYCTTDGKGNRTCQTCVRTKYTVDWKVYTSVGNHTIKSLDSRSSSVYLTPDPKRYLDAYNGEAAAANHTYKNYMLGVPKEYLYNDNLGAPRELLAKIPEYPSTFDYYRVDRVVTIDDVITPREHAYFSANLAHMLRTLGPQKEVNIIMVIGKPEPKLMYAVREKWNGGKKNDVIIVFNINDDKSLDDVHVLTWDKNHYFKIRLQDELLAYGVFDNGIMPKIHDTIRDHYTRPEMKDYEHLREHVQTPRWLLIIFFIILGGVPVATFFISRK